MNLYGFTANNPISLWDTLGLNFSGYTCHKSITTYDVPNCGEFGSDGGTRAEYIKAFKKDESTGRLKMLDVPKNLRSALAYSMADELGMKPEYYYGLRMKLSYCTKEETKMVDECVCASGKRKVTQHAIKMHDMTPTNPGKVTRYDDKAGTVGEKDVTPDLPAWAGPQPVDGDCAK